MAGLPAPGRCQVLMDVAGTRFGVVWDADHGFDVRTAPHINDVWDFGFAVPASAWEEFAKPSPAPLNNTAQALVAQFGDTLIAGDRAKWAQYAPFVERILFCLKPTGDRGQAPELPHKSAITASYVTIDYQGREYRLFYEQAGQGIPMICVHTAGSDSRQYKYMLEDPELQADFRMIAFDMPWHGRSMPPRGWRGERYENDIGWYMQIIRGFTAAMDLREKPILIGCSMGGSVALTMSGTYGSGVAGHLRAGRHPGRKSRRPVTSRRMDPTPRSRPQHVAQYVGGRVDDVDPSAVVGARRRILSELGAANTVGFAVHFGDQPFGTVTGGGTDPLTWQSLPTAVLLPPPRNV